MAIKKKIKDIIAEKLYSDILDGKYKAGTFLPPERELAESFGIGRNTLRTALKNLVNKNVIRINPGRGIYVNGMDLCRNKFSRILVYGKTSIMTKSSEMTRVLAGICEGASNYNADVIISFSDNPSPVGRLIDRYASGDIHGIIFFEECDYEGFHIPLSKASVPHVVANLEFDMDVVSTRMDYRSAGRLAGRYLMKLGHRNIGVISREINRPRNIYREMLAGFKGALAEEDLFLDKNNIVEIDPNEIPGREKCLDYLKSSEKNMPTAIFCMRDKCASWLYDACNKLGIKIPSDLSVISYDDISWSDAKASGLTTIKEKMPEMGKTAIDILFEWSHAHVPPSDRILQGELVERMSCIPFKSRTNRGKE